MRAWLSWLVLFCVLGTPALGVTVQKVPRPPRGTWTVDLTPSHVLTQATKAEVNRIANELNDRGLGQLAVVVVGTTSGQPSRMFALDLFNRWGIGHAGRNDGVLLFVALSDRKAEIILGDGVNGPEDQRASDAVMADDVVPGFKRNDPNAAVLQGALGLKALLENARLNNPNAAAASTDAPISMGAVADTDPQPATTEPYVSRPEEPSSSSGLGFVVGGAGVLGAAGLAGRAWFRRRPRKCGRCGNLRVRLDERADNAHLDAGQRFEESLGSVDYDVWWCDPCEDALVERYGALFTSFSRCSRCNYVTVKQTSRTLVSATYDHGGEVEVTRTCGHCDHVTTSRHSTPRRTRPSSSSSSRSSSRSSGSSFGGGRSSGGGSSGSW
ncbi:TPM domain-containing protein [Pyxidicoccus parkwayensis]|uniref:TPM domain-containing protein n=1 Tax=Pyxidicoccus parkwayensis TaxID=2813578 RepID=A0ABX7P4N7_9BACT|nr:TPM domain-containing protein [Pyxidicoccus parkwaysis]QSQ25450.1 TPM domain-containing protein [Pyxidicoccus parkwaysis]